MPPPPRPRAVHTLPDAAATEAFGATLAAALGPGDLVFLEGEIGAGKTTLTRALVRALTRPDQEVPSPTFTLVQTYETARGPLWHCDLYRLGDVSELAELGLDEAIGRDLVLVEWPDRLGADAPAPSLRLTLRPGPGEGRLLEEIRP
ncbi:MAG: tRNA (adenosine(37)-N6)-threonylcarbamoyltransferase complex ATPase subunit type 1 TsaE [Shimia sp.]